MKKYIAYCRKSRDEADRQILSIEAQIAELKEFAKKEKLEIVEFITEAKTAKMPGREQFAELLKKVERGFANGIVAWHPDRLARNSMDGGKIVYFLDTGKLVDLKFPTFWFENTPQGKFMLSIAFGQSKYYVDNLSENVRRGQRQKLRNGVLPLKAPFGYVNNPKTRGIDIDPETSKIVKEMFTMFAQGNKSFTDILRHLFDVYDLKKKNGKPWHIDTIRHHLSNKFYVGIITFNGEYYDGIHEPIISKELFAQTQQQINKISRPQYGGNHFPFIGLARCGSCGAAITAETHTKIYKMTHRTATYHYYRCTRKLKPCLEKPVTGEDLENQLRQILSDVSLPQSWANQWNQWIDRDEIVEKQTAEETLQKLNDQLADIDRKANILLDSYLDQVIDSETYKQKKNQFFEEKIKLQEMIAKVELQGSTWIEPMREFVKTAVECEKIARAKKNPDDLAIIGKRVGSNFLLTNRRFTADFGRGFATLCATCTAQSFPTRSPSLSFLVEVRRFERRLMPEDMQPVQILLPKPEDYSGLVDGVKEGEYIERPKGKTVVDWREAKEKQTESLYKTFSIKPPQDAVVVEDDIMNYLIAVLPIEQTQKGKPTLYYIPARDQEAFTYVESVEKHLLISSWDFSS